MINLIPSDDQQAIANGVAEFLGDALPLDRFRRGRAGEDRWVDLAALGGFGVSVPEEAGGIGLGILEDVLVFREYGRHLVSPAAIGTRLAACMAAREAPDIAADLLAGRRRAGLATDLGETFQLLAAGPADYIVCEAPGELLLFAPGSVTGREECGSLDQALTLAHARLNGEPVLRCRDPQIVLSARLLAAAMLCGVLDITRDMAADYAQTREQFGLPIGVFQGVKHRCADIGLAAEEAWSYVAYAALMLHAGAEDAAFHAKAAKLTAGENALAACRGNIQIFAGMGFTDEVDAHLLLKRSHVLHQLFEDPRTVVHGLLRMTIDV